MAFKVGDRVILLSHGHVDGDDRIKSLTAKRGVLESGKSFRLSDGRILSSYGCRAAEVTPEMERRFQEWQELQFRFQCKQLEQVQHQ